MTQTKSNGNALTASDVRAILYNLAGRALLVVAALRGRPDPDEGTELPLAIEEIVTDIRTRLLSLAGGDESGFIEKYDRAEQTERRAVAS